jgi:hypothetical protein
VDDTINSIVEGYQDMVAALELSLADDEKWQAERMMQGCETSILIVEQSIQETKQLIEEIRSQLIPLETKETIETTETIETLETGRD